MKIPFSWLKEYVDTDLTPKEIEEKLFSCGFEVEELVYLGKDVENVVTGKIVRCEKHPDADRLTVCTVDCGGYGTKQIVTAATNVFEGATVPCALDGATVKEEGGSRKIKTGKLRGVTSEGMFCSGEELGITDDFYDGAEVNGILILDMGTPLGVDIRPIVGIDDYIFDIAVTANRPDCMSVYGIAREVAAVLKRPLKHLVETWFHPVPTDVKFSVEVKDPKLCPLYVGTYVKDVKIGVSPRWMRRRLALMGLRSVNNIVDVTNYVLLEVGQPMHAFDRKFLRGDKIVVRRAEEGEKIVTLDEKEFTLTPDNLLICDGERPVALAGIMGGLNSEIKEETSEVFLEAAVFARDSVRKTSRALGQRSDSSARFEKGVYEIFPWMAMTRALILIEELGCGTPTKCTAVGNLNSPSEYGGIAPKMIETTYDQIDGLLGIHVPKEEIYDILKRLNFGVTDMGASFSVSVPLERGDIDGWPDIAEEVIRMYGYDHIVPTFLERATVTRGGLTEAQKLELHLKETLVGEGYFEACGYSFYSPKDLDLLRLPEDDEARKAIVIKNPIGEDLSVMRTVLAPTMIANVVRNVRRGNESGKLFELASTYHAQSLPLTELPEEHKFVSIGLWGEGDFFTLKGAVEAVGEAFGAKFSYARGTLPFLHPGATAEVFLGEKKIGWIGELHPSISESLALERKAFLAELDYEAIAAVYRPLAYRPLPKFPEVSRDIAVVVDEGITCAQVETCILHACKAAVKAELFDVYRDDRLGAGKKSMAFRVTFRSEDRALTPETVDGYFKKAVNNLKHNLGGELR